MCTELCDCVGALVVGGGGLLEAEQGGSLLLPTAPGVDDVLAGCFERSDDDPLSVSWESRKEIKDTLKQIALVR